LEGYKSVVNKRDIVFFLGDIAFDVESLELIKDLPGDKRLVLGNHDTDRKVDIANLCLVFDQIHGLYKYKHAWLSHAPIHQDELRGKINIHGHTHNHHVKDRRYVNICVEHTNMRPIEYQRIIDGWRPVEYD
jgi:calcineurin-like phosphoesterase family protein